MLIELASVSNIVEIDPCQQKKNFKQCDCKCVFFVCLQFLSSLSPKNG